MEPAARREALYRTAGYLCVEWTVGAAMGAMVRRWRRAAPAAGVTPRNQWRGAPGSERELT